MTQDGRAQKRSPTTQKQAISQVKSTTETPRKTAVKILNIVDSTGGHADKVLTSELQKSKLSPLDRSLVTEIVNGTLRWRAKIDWVLERFYQGNFKKCPHIVKIVLEISLYQIFFLTKIPDYAVVSEAVEIVKEIGQGRWSGLVNGILRNIIRNKDEIDYPKIEKDPVSALAVKYSHPRWMVGRWLERLGLEETIALLAANNRRPKVTLRVNSLKIDSDSLLRLLTEHGIKAEKSSLSEGFLVVENIGDLEELPPFQKGFFVVQDISAGLVSLLLSPKEGDIVIDLCSAPGGKTTHLAELMRNTGRIIAMDKFETRLRLVRENSLRLGVKNVSLLVGDGLEMVFKEADKVLVDAPCSGLGVLAKRADLRWRRRPQDIRNFADLQLNLLLNASAAVKKGGALVYSTCTTEPEENEEVVERFLNERKNFVMEDASRFVDPSLVDQKGCIRTLPHRHGIDGSFAVRLVRVR